MTRQPCDCEHCLQDRAYRQKDVPRLYDASPIVDRRVALLVTVLSCLAILGVAASWWVHR